MKWDTMKWERFKQPPSSDVVHGCNADTTQRPTTTGTATGSRTETWIVGEKFYDCDRGGAA